MIMLKYSNTFGCPKCGLIQTDQFVNYVCARCEVEEHLQITCSRCRYFTDMECFDKYHRHGEEE